MNDSHELEIETKHYRQIIEFNYCQIKNSNTILGELILKFLLQNRMITMDDIVKVHLNTNIETEKYDPIIDNIDTSGFDTNMLDELNNFIKNQRI